MANLRALLFLAVAALMLAPAAAAQVSPIAPVATINGFGLAPTSATVPLGGSMNFTIAFGSLVVKNTICQAAVPGTIVLSFSDNGPVGVTGALPPTGIPITFAASAGTDATATRTDPAAVLNFVVSAAASAAPNHVHTFQVNATYTGPTTGCNNTGGQAMDPQPTDMETIMVTITTGPSKGNTTTTPPIGCTAGSTAASCTNTPAPTSQASPLADVPTVALMVLGVALVVSRRKK